MTRLFGRSTKGTRSIGYVPRNRGTVTTLIGAMSLEGLQTVMTIEGATDGDVFRAFVEHFLVPDLIVGDVVVMDNLGAHRARGIRELIEEAGAGVLYLPPYHPELNPIEEGWSKLKQFLRSEEARNVGDLDSAIAAGADAITIEDTIGWFDHAGYQVI
jgi:transposase